MLRNLLLALCLIGLITMLTDAEVRKAQATERANILFIMADDLDLRTYQRAMPLTQKYVQNTGMRFRNATFSYPVCCPSRASILRGQYTHNTMVQDNDPPRGGYSTFHNRGLHRDTYGTRVNARGYVTGYLGKVMNGYEGGKLPGFDVWFGASVPPSGEFVNGNGQRFDYANGSHDQVVTQHAQDFLRKATQPGRPPFLLAVNFHGPHVPENGSDADQKRFTSEPLPRPPSYDEHDMSDKPRRMRSWPKAGPQIERARTIEHRRRLRASAFIDRQVKSMVGLLSSRNELDNTYVFFYSDNGYHIGQHRQPGTGTKRMPYIEDARFPILVRGPGVPHGKVSQAMVQNIDLRPTFEDIANASATGYADGASMLPAMRGGTFPRKYALSENLSDASIPRWRAVYTPNTAYHLWLTTGEREFYDLAADPWQLDARINARERLLLDEHRKAMFRMGNCDGAECRR